MGESEKKEFSRKGKKKLLSLRLTVHEEGPHRKNNSIHYATWQQKVSRRTERDGKS